MARDDDQIRAALKIGLELRGYAVDTASDGRKPLRLPALLQEIDRLLER